jgi:hypothetical protein
MANSCQQFSGQNDMTLPLGNVMLRSNPQREPSLARLTSNLTDFPSAFSTSIPVLKTLLRGSQLFLKPRGSGPVWTSLGSFGNVIWINKRCVQNSIAVLFT